MRFFSVSFGIGALVIVALASACDLFGRVACSEDADCPDAIPFCNSDFCEAEADDGRPGRGVDGCSEDSDCTDRLCDIDGAFGEAGNCLPPEGTDDCAGEPTVQAPPRDADGPVIFAISATSIGDGCFSNVTFSYLDRDDDLSVTSPNILIVVGGDERVQSISSSGDDTTISIGTLCGAAPTGISGLMVRDGASHASNTLCLNATGAP